MTQAKAISAPSSPTHLHPIVLARLGPSDWGEAAPLDRRALQIESDLYHAMDARGHRVEPGRLLVEGELITFGLYEASQRTSERLTRKDEGYRKDRVQWRQAWSPSGRLMLVLRLKGWGGERRWSERPGELLETQVDRFTLRLERLVQDKAAHEARWAADQQEAEIARRHTARRVFKEQERKRRPGVVRALAERWEEAARLRAFLDAVEGRFSPLTASMSEWLAAAREDVEAIDPLSHTGLSALQFHVDAVAKGPEDDAPRHPDELYWFDEGAMDELVDEIFGHVRLPTNARIDRR